ncbi:TatD family hydrolase [Candidatus Saccharibacteria bacterium]|nr:TatD family hydrolase [Candidatus Saccharibacteria bacterium]
MLVDTHCHIHESNYRLPINDVLDRAKQANVIKMLCVGTDSNSSKEAVSFSKQHRETYATVGVHPHESTEGYAVVENLLSTKKDEIVAVGEIGLDYYYDNSPRQIQREVFEAQLQLAVDAGLPVIFHIRDRVDNTKNESVWKDFWSIFYNFPKLSGVLHSFTDNISNLETALSEGLFIGVNGISTFAKDKQAMWDTIPIEKMLLETDAPFLTPVPFRGTVNEPAYVRNIAEYHAKRRGVELSELAFLTSKNASELFSI